MQVIPRVTHEPAGHLRHLVGAVVVHDDVHFTGGGELRIDPLQKLQELLVPMTPMAVPDHFPGGDVQRRKQ